MDGHRTHTKMRQLAQQGLTSFLALIFLVTGFEAEAQAHAVPVRSEPKLASTIATSPPKVTIWFDRELEPAFSTITVYNSAKKRVDKYNGRVNPLDATALEVDLLALPSGTYRVYWSVAAKDLHRTEGDFLFTIKEK
jgi:methionine-rich copper-binding protein CopC